MINYKTSEMFSLNKKVINFYAFLGKSLSYKFSKKMFVKNVRHICEGIPEATVRKRLH